MSKQIVVQANSVSKRLGDRFSVNEVSLQVQEGELFGIIGADGAGKTTLLDILTGLAAPDAGSVKILGLDVMQDVELLKEEVGVHLIHASLIDKMSVRGALELFQGFYRRNTDVELTIEQFGLRPYADKLIKRLSGGWRQRVSLAISMVNDPKIIFLDEPTTGLDLQAKKDYWMLLRQLKLKGKTIMIASHDMEMMKRHCDRVGVMRCGEWVACDHPTGLISNLPYGGMTMEAVYMHYAVEMEKSLIM